MKMMRVKGARYRQRAEGGGERDPGRRDQVVVAPTRLFCAPA